MVDVEEKVVVVVVVRDSDRVAGREAPTINSTMQCKEEEKEAGHGIWPGHTCRLQVSKGSVGIGLASRFPDLRLPLLVPGTLSDLLFRPRACTPVATKREATRTRRRCLRSWGLLHNGSDDGGGSCEGDLGGR